MKTNGIDFSPAAPRSNSLQKVHFCRVTLQSALESSVFIVKSLREGFPNLHSLIPSRLSAAGLFLVLLFPVWNKESKREYKRARKEEQKEKKRERSREKRKRFSCSSSR